MDYSIASRKPNVSCMSSLRTLARMACFTGVGAFTEIGLGETQIEVDEGVRPMQWRVIKLGSDMFDNLHTYGIGIVVASATQQLVTILEEGCSYVLSSPCITPPQVGPGLLDEIFRLPSLEEVLHILAGTVHAF